MRTPKYPDCPCDFDGTARRTVLLKPPYVAFGAASAVAGGLGELDSPQRPTLST